MVEPLTFFLSVHATTKLKQSLLQSPRLTANVKSWHLPRSSRRRPFYALVLYHPTLSSRCCVNLQHVNAQPKKSVGGPPEQVFKRRKISSLLPHKKALGLQITTKTNLGLLKSSSLSSTGSNTEMPRNKQDSIAWTPERVELLVGLLQDHVRQTGECKLNKRLCETWATNLSTKFNYSVMATQVKHKKKNLRKEWAFLKSLDGATGLGVNLENGEFDFFTEYRLKLIKTNPRATRYLSKDAYLSFKILDSIFARSTASGTLVFGTASSHAPVAEQWSEDEDLTKTLAEGEHGIDDVVNDVRGRLNRLRAMSSNAAEGIGNSSQSVRKGKRKMKDTEEGEDWLKVMAQAIVKSKTKPNAQFAKCIRILTEMGYTGPEKLRLQMVLKDDIGLQTMFLENENE